MADSGYRRPDPDRLLRLVEAEERGVRRGKLKVFLGYASGVGKSYRMMDEGRRRRLRGQDVVVAATQREAAPEVEELLRGFEVIPPLGGGRSPAIDLAVVLRRHPGVCLIDGLAYENPEGSRNRQRWQDVEEMLRAGISVITSINVQYVEELQARVEQIRGRSVRESVPQSFLQMADEIEVVDAPPEYCLPGTVERDAKLERQLSELREAALLLAADVVDHQLEEYLRREGIDQAYGAQERILVCVTPRSNAELMIRRGRRQADRFHGELHVLYVKQGELSAEDEERLRYNLREAEAAEAKVAVLDGEDAIETIIRYAGEHGITQIFAGHTQRKGRTFRFRSNPLERLILEAQGVDVRIFPHKESRHG